MRSIGIDIGSYSIKVAELEYSSRDVKLVNYQEYPLPIGASTDNYVNIIEKLKEIVDRYDKDLDRFVVGLSQEMVCNRFVSFPFKEKYKIAQTIGFELEDDLPFNIDDSIVHPKITYTKEDRESYVIAFAALKGNIQNYLSIFQDVGIEPDIVSSDGASLSNYFENWQSAPKNYSEEQELPNQAKAVLHIGHQRSILAVERSGHLVSLRTIHYGGEDIAQAISEKYNVTFTEGIKTLQEKAFVLLSQKEATQEQITFSNLISNCIDTLASEVKRHMLSVESDMDIHIDEVFISGGTAGIQNIAPYLTQSLYVSTNPINKDFQYLPLLEDIPPKMRSASLIALGLAIEGTKSIKNPAVNFRKEEFEKKSKTLELFFNKWGETLKTLGVVFIIFCAYTFTRSIISGKINQQSGEQLKSIANSIGLRGRQATKSQIENYVFEKKKEIRAKEMIAELQNINSPLDVLLSMSKLSPNKNAVTLDVSRWQLRGNQVRVDGFVDNTRQVRLIKNALENLSVDKKIEVNPTSIRQKNKTGFSYSLKTKRNVGAL